MIGPGKYDLECVELLNRLKAKGVILIVIQGQELGSGFSCNVDASIAPVIPELLTKIASQIREDTTDLARETFFGFKKHPEQAEWGSGEIGQKTSCDWDYGKAKNENTPDRPRK